MDGIWLVCSQHSRTLKGCDMLWANVSGTQALGCAAFRPVRAMASRALKHLAGMQRILNIAAGVRFSRELHAAGRCA